MPVSTLQLMASTVFSFRLRLLNWMRSYTYKICIICRFFYSLFVLTNKLDSFSSFQLQIPIRCNSLFRVLLIADSFFESCMLSASAQYFWRGSIQNLNFIGWLNLKTWGSPVSESPANRQLREQMAPLSSKALLSSALVFRSIFFSAPITYQPIRINSQQKFMLFCPFLSLRVSYSIIRETSSEALVWLVPRGAVRVIVQESSCWRAQSSPQERPQLVGMFLEWQMVMPTKLIGLISISSMFARRFVLYILDLMILGRGIALNGAFFRSIFCYTPADRQTPLFNYQNFFKEIQKASNPHEALNIYKTYSQDQENLEKYLAITMRILTRVCRRKDLNHIFALKDFFNSSKTQLLGLNVTKLDGQSLRDFLVYFYNSIQNNTMTKTIAEEHLIHSCIKEFNSRFTGSKAKYQLFNAPTLFSSIRVANAFCPSIEPELINNAVTLIHSHADSLVNDSFAFSNLLYTLRIVFTPNSIHHQKLVHAVFFFFSMQDYFKKFDEYSLVNVLLTIVAIQKKRTPASPVSTTLLLKDIHDSIEAMLLKDMMKFSQRTHSFMVQGIQKTKVQHRLLGEYFKIIEQCIDGQGGARINPKVLVWALSQLSKEQASAYLSTQWQQNFIKMLSRYFGPTNKFERPISYELLIILEKQLLTRQNSQQLYTFYTTQLKAYKQDKEKQAIAVKEKKVHSLYGGIKEKKK